MNTSKNPLEKLYRTKSVYIGLPSGGKFYTSGITLSVDGEIGIMPMTATDEIKLKTPDSLFNGEALYELFRSCVPDIINPEEIPACDVDKLLLGIRLATSGPDLEIKSKCPKCNKSDEYHVDLSTIMNSAEEIPNDVLVELDDNVVVEICPLTLHNQVMQQVETFYQFRMQQLLNDNTTSDEIKAEQFKDALTKAIVVQTGQVANCITSVNMDGELVTDNEYIFQWVENMSSPTHKKLKKRIALLSDAKMKNTVHLKCAEDGCNHEYKAVVDLNPVNFF
jgi:hypothetical protein